MTGDGVNDAPALQAGRHRRGDGLGGTEVAKEAADMVLTDDNFATIEAAVEEGRGVFDNLTKFIVWTLPTNMGEGLVILAAISVGAGAADLPRADPVDQHDHRVLLGLMLAFEPKEPRHHAPPAARARRADPHRQADLPHPARGVDHAGRAFGSFKWALGIRATATERRPHGRRERVRVRRVVLPLQLPLADEVDVRDRAVFQPLDSCGASGR
jgi:cation-transporting P-type ATPase F